MEKLLRIAPGDNVAVALAPVAAGERVLAGEAALSALQAVPRGHKLALREIPAGVEVIKYGHPIGRATERIPAGGWVHVHNLATNLSQVGDYRYEPAPQPPEPAAPRTFSGYRRGDGRVGVRNELWIIPLVGCVGDIAEALAAQNRQLVEAHGLDGLHAFPHPYGCSQMGEDHAATRRLLADLVRHPNAGAVLVLALGCENITMAQFREELGEWDPERVRFLVCQEVADEMAAGAALLEELAAYAGRFRREPLSASELVVGLKCGGSDGLSGVTANPAVGAFSDRLIAQGGSAVLTEVPEMFGAEAVLLARCESRAVYEQAVAMLDGFKRYYAAHGQVVYENPSPGNKEGGISTLEDKSLGCVQKGGSAPVVDVLDYGGRVRKRGLSLLAAPGNDLVSATALVAAGCHIVLFTTGRGTPFGTPVPTLKIASNRELFRQKDGWMDFDAGGIAEGEPIGAAGQRLLDLVLDTASGRRCRAEENHCRGIAIFKNGVTL